MTIVGRLAVRLRRYTGGTVSKGIGVSMSNVSGKAGNGPSKTVPTWWSARRAHGFRKAPASRKIQPGDDAFASVTVSG